MCPIYLYFRIIIKQLQTENKNRQTGLLSGPGFNSMSLKGEEKRFQDLTGSQAQQTATTQRETGSYEEGGREGLLSEKSIDLPSGHQTFSVAESLFFGHTAEYNPNSRKFITVLMQL